MAAGSMQRRKVDVCVYGGASGGGAAVAHARLGRAVVVIEPKLRARLLDAGQGGDARIQARSLTPHIDGAVSE